MEKSSVPCKRDIFGSCKTSGSGAVYHFPPYRCGIFDSCKTPWMKNGAGRRPHRRGIFGGCKTRGVKELLRDTLWRHSVFSSYKTLVSAPRYRALSRRRGVESGWETPRAANSQGHGHGGAVFSVGAKQTRKRIWRRESHGSMAFFDSCKTGTRVCAGEVGCSSPFAERKDEERTARRGFRPVSQESWVPPAPRLTLAARRGG